MCNTGQRRWQRTGDNRSMKLQQTKLILTAIWVLAMLGVSYAANTAATSNWITLAALTVVPPIAMWFFWNDPPQTMSESIHKARRG